jgi:hypothetical protein
MKKSGKVTLGFVAGAAMVLLGCQRSEMQRCVDGRDGDSRVGRADYDELEPVCAAFV